LWNLGKFFKINAKNIF